MMRKEWVITKPLGYDSKHGGQVFVHLNHRRNLEDAKRLTQETYAGDVALTWIDHGTWWSGVVYDASGSPDISYILMGIAR